MPRLTARLARSVDMAAVVRDRSRLFLVAERAAATQAAAVATIESRSGFQYKRELAPPRSKRSSTGGRMTQGINWRLDRNGQVALDVEQLDSFAPHWIIQEIGTGQSAVVRRGGAENPVGRPAGGANYVRTVRSQVGRRISPGLVWARNGRYSQPGAARGEQLFLRSQIPDAGAPRRFTGMTIRNEIDGQHFIREGAKQGFRQYRSSVLSAARQTFRKRGSL